MGCWTICCTRCASSDWWVTDGKEEAIVTRIGHDHGLRKAVRVVTVGVGGVQTLGTHSSAAAEVRVHPAVTPVLRTTGRPGIQDSGRDARQRTLTLVRQSVLMRRAESHGRGFVWMASTTGADEATASKKTWWSLVRKIVEHTFDRQRGLEARTRRTHGPKRRRRRRGARVNNWRLGSISGRTREGEDGHTRRRRLDDGSQCN